MSYLKRYRRQIAEFRAAVDTGIVIYSMGRVGSKTILRALEKAGIAVVHVHWLAGFYPFRVPNYRFFPDNRLIRASREFLRVRRRMILKRGVRKSRPVRIVTGVRDPFDRDISHMFLDLPSLLPLAAFGEDAFADSSAPEFLWNVYEGLVNKEYATGYFDKEFLPVLGADLYGMDFDRHEGWGIYRRDNLSILVLRMDRLADNLDVINDFTGAKIDCLDVVNSGARKWYACLYREFLGDFSLDPRIVECVYNSRYVRKFFTPDQIREKRRRFGEMKKEPERHV